jgi:hypothetical protein
MSMKKYLYLIIILLFTINSDAQEFNCKVNVNADQITGVEANVFKTLELSLSDFINTRKWGNDVFQNKEKIELVFTLILSKKIDGVEGGYLGRLSVQSKRPVFNSSYSSTIVNYTDKDLAIKYIEFQPIEFNDNRVVTNDALSSNLPAIISYYCYIALGLDYDSFSLKGGTEFYNKALNIANNAPENNAIVGWKATESQRNRFWLIDQLHNNRFDKMRTIFYQYHRLGLDLLTSDPDLGRANINGLIPILKEVNQENPSSMLMQFYFSSKSEEFQNFISGATMADKQKMIPILSQLDVVNANKYIQLLK